MNNSAGGCGRSALKKREPRSCYTLVYTMNKSLQPRTAKLFLNGRSQAVRLPAEFRFEGTEVLIWVDPDTENVVLSRRPPSWDDFFKMRKDAGKIPRDFLSDRHDEPPQTRDLF